MRGKMKLKIKETIENLGPYFFDYSVDDVIEKLKPYSGMSLEVNSTYDSVEILLVNYRDESDEEYQFRLDKERENDQRELEKAKERAKKALEKEKQLLAKLKAKYE
jgi:hypothetical protein